MSDDNDIVSSSSSGEPILALINLARLRKVGLREQYNTSNLDVDWNIVSYVDRCLTEYKNKMNLYDFTDMLAAFVEQSETCCPQYPNLSLIHISEPTRPY